MDKEIGFLYLFAIFEQVVSFNIQILLIQIQANMEKLITCKSVFTLITTVFLNFHADTIFGQNTVSTTGGHFKSTGGSTSFTVGQVVYVLKKGNGPYLNEGVQQVYIKNILKGTSII